MANFKRWTALLMAALLCVGVLLTGCGNDGGGEDTSGSDTTTAVPGSEAAYTVRLRSAGGMKLANVNFRVYNGDIPYMIGVTDENGMATVSLPVGGNYSVQLTESDLLGYELEERYSFNGTSLDLVLTSHVIEEENDLSGVTYSVGDVMYDFSVVTSDGSTFKLSEALKEKDAVLINFWYTTCSPCVTEFPNMQAAYKAFEEDIAVIGLNNYPGDNEDAVAAFKESMGLTFDLAKDYSALGTAFELRGYPTSILVDRYGVICLIEVGGPVSEKSFKAGFAQVTGDDYEQKLLTSLDELTPIELPNVEMPSSEEIGEAFNSGDISVTYAPETSKEWAEYSWSFVIGEKNGETCIYASNQQKDSSYAILHATVEMKAGDVLAFDWLASTEKGVDILFVMMDGEDLYQISGAAAENEEEKWSTCFPFVAIEDGTYALSLWYVKDGEKNIGDDTVYLKDLRILTEADITTPTYVPRQAATHPKSNNMGFNSYVEVFYNEEDGYYHVGTVDGPLLLADLIGGTQFGDVSINQLGYNGELTTKDGVNLYEDLLSYCTHASNSSFYGLCPVTQELKTLLEQVMDLPISLEQNNPNEWLQVCCYYDAYGTDGVELGDPIKGLDYFCAFEAVESTEEAPAENTVTYDRLIMPRGLIYRFTPARSGVYRILSNSDQEVNAWIFLEGGEAPMYTFEHSARFIEDVDNCDIIIYLEEGVDYYINIAYYDLYAVGSFTFTVEYIDETYEYFRSASPGYFTYIESTNGTLNNIIALGIDVIYNEETGYYHEKLANGQPGSVVYADFLLTTSIFSSNSISQMIGLDAFNFSISETDHEILVYMQKHGDNVVDYLKELWGDSFEENAEIYQIEDVFDGVYHGKGEDMTAAISAYLDDMIEKTDEAPELEGCVPVTKELAELLQLLMDKYTFAGVENSWIKLCYYYDHLGPVAE